MDIYIYIYIRWPQEHSIHLKLRQMREAHARASRLRFIFFESAHVAYFCDTRKRETNIAQETAGEDTRRYAKIRRRVGSDRARGTGLLRQRARARTAPVLKTAEYTEKFARFLYREREREKKTELCQLVQKKEISHQVF